MKAQAASEFLITYGSAILVTIAAIAILVTMGMPKLTGVESCIFPPGMDCIGKPVVTKTHMLFALKNSIDDMILTNVSICSNPTVSIGENMTYTSLPIKIKRQEIFRINVSCNLQEGKIDENVIILFYNPRSGIEIPYVGEIKAII